MNVVDSSAWLAYFAGEPAADFFAPAIEDTARLIVPVICLYEVFRVILRERGEEDAFAAVVAMQQGRIVELDATQAIEAAATGHDEKLAMADAIIYTITQRHAATLWTQDAHFASKPAVRYLAKTAG